MRVTINEIAKIAGVSPATVSNALNDKKGINEETKNSVKQIASELGYQKPDTIKTHSVKFVIYKRNGTIIADTPFFSEIIQVVEQNFSRNHYETSIVHITGPEQQKESIRRFVKSDGLSGILILATEMLEADLELFEDIQLPVVLIDSRFQNRDMDSVTINNHEGAFSAVNYLLTQGHSNIGYLRSSYDINNFRERKKGFVEALRSHDLKEDPQFEYFLEPTYEGSFKDMKKILKAGNSLPSALFVDNDVIAFGAMKAIKECGLKIPDDVSLISFDDMPFCEISDPRLSSVRLYPREIGIAAVNRLLYKIRNQDTTIQKIEVGTKLIVRESGLWCKVLNP